MVAAPPDRGLGGDHDQGPGFVRICFGFLSIGGGGSVFGPMPETTRDLDLILGQDNMAKQNQWGLLFVKFDDFSAGRNIICFVLLEFDQYNQKQEPKELRL